DHEHRRHPAPLPGDVFGPPDPVVAGKGFRVARAGTHLMPSVEAFVHIGSPATIVFGAGRSAEAADWIGRAGGNRALVLSTPGREAEARVLAGRMGSLASGIFSGAAMHTPVEVTERA